MSSGAQPEAGQAGTGATAKDEQLEPRRVRTEDTRLTTDQGVRVDHTDDALTVGERGPTLLEDFHAREKITHFDHERIPERVVYARGAGAYGTFRPYHGRSSPALSQLNTTFDSCATRSVAVLVADGVDGPEAGYIRDLLGEHGVLVELLAHSDGTVRSARVDDVEVDRAINTVASVLYDAVVVPGGAQSLATLSEDGYVVHFVTEAYKHAKAVGGCGEGTAEFLDRCGVRENRSGSGGVFAENGVILADSGGDYVADFVEKLAGQLAGHRNWERETDSVPA